MLEGPEPVDGVEWAERHLTAAFDRMVLARYKCSLDLFDVDEDDCGGRLRCRGDAEAGKDSADAPKYWEARYGFRHLSDGRVCVVAWLPDLEALPERERNAWAVDLLEAPSFATEDPTYERWRARILQGEWSEAGPLEALREHLHRIRAVSLATLGESLFAASDSPLVHYPLAENSAELLSSLSELHRLVIDGLRVKALRKLADLMTVSFDRDARSLGLLKSLLPLPLIPLIHAPLDRLRSARNDLHRVPAPRPQRLPAFDRFWEDAHAIADATRSLLAFLVEQLDADEDACVRRLEVLESPMHTTVLPLGFRHADTDRLAEAQSKTIERVEIGKAGGMALGFARDAIALYFTDGSHLVISPMPNVGNWEDRVQGFSRSDLNVHLDVDFVPSGSRTPANSPVPKPKATRKKAGKRKAAKRGKKAAGRAKKK